MALFLLLCFSATLLPADLFHPHHANAQTGICKNTGGQQCQHKSHLLNKQSFCWVCAVHFDKNFLAEPVSLSGFTNPTPSLKFIHHSLRFYQAAIAQRSLRGPPAV